MSDDISEGACAIRYAFGTPVDEINSIFVLKLCPYSDTLIIEVCSKQNPSRQSHSREIVLFVYDSLYPSSLDGHILVEYEDGEIFDCNIQNLIAYNTMSMTLHIMKDIKTPQLFSYSMNVVPVEMICLFKTSQNRFGNFSHLCFIFYLHLDDLLIKIDAEDRSWEGHTL